jgi:hypothetical protein
MAEMNPLRRRMIEDMTVKRHAIGTPDRHLKGALTHF